MTTSLEAYAPLYPESIVFGATSSIARSFYDYSQGKFSVVLTASADCFIRVGTASVAAASNTGWLLRAGEVYKFKVSTDSNYFRVIQSSGGGTLFWYVPGAQSPSYTSILGSNLVGLWDSRYNASSAAWVDRIQGISLTGSNSPTLGLDGVNYKSQPVFTFNGTNQGFDSGSLGADLIPTAARAWACVVGRAVSAPVGGQKTLEISDGAVAVEEILCVGDNIGLALVTDGRASGANVGAESAPQSSPSMWEIFLDSAGVRNFARNGTIVATNGAGLSSGTAARRLQVGGLVSAGSSFANWTVMGVFVCTAAPTTAQRAALRFLILQDMGV